MEERTGRLVDIFDDPRSQDEARDLIEDLMKQEVKKTLEDLAPEVFFGKLVPEMREKLKAVRGREPDEATLIYATAVSYNLQKNGNSNTPPGCK